MLSLSFFFWSYIALFAVVGAMRGWARELLVSFSVVLALFIITVLDRFIPFVRDTLTGTSRFWVQAGIVLALVFFGYQTPNIPHLAMTNRFIREHFQDTLLGLFLGAINGYLIIGSLWYFLHEAGYPFTYITPPVAGDPLGDAALKLIPFLPPYWMGAPVIYLVVGIAFIFVLVVFI